MKIEGGPFMNDDEVKEGFEKIMKSLNDKEEYVHPDPQVFLDKAIADDKKEKRLKSSKKKKDFEDDSLQTTPRMRRLAEIEEQKRIAELKMLGRDDY